MWTFTLAISCLTTSNLPWFMDLTFQVPMQYCSLQHWILLLSPVTSTTGHCFCFGFIPSFFLELFFHWWTFRLLLYLDYLNKTNKSRQIGSGQTGDGNSELQHSRNQWTKMDWLGEFNSDDRYIYYCGQESLRRNGVANMVSKRVWNAVLGCNLKNERMISVHF